MSAIATCPTCQGLVTLPSDARASTIVRCPLCHGQYKLDSVHEEVVPALEVVTEDLHVFEPSTELGETVNVGEPVFEEQADDAVSADELGLNIEHTRDGEAVAEPAQFSSEEIRFEPLDIAQQEPLDLEEAGASKTSGEDNGADFVKLVPPEPLAELEQDEAPIEFAPEDEEQEEIDFAPSELDELDRERSHAEAEAELPASEFELHPRDSESEEELAAEASDLSFEPTDVPFVPVPEDDEGEIHLASDDVERFDFQEVGAAAGAGAAQPVPDIPFSPQGRKKKAEPSLLGNLIGVVGGGVIGISLAYIGLLRFGGPDRDVLGLGHKLPEWLVGSGFEAPVTSPVAMVGTNGTPPIARDPEVARKLDDQKGPFAPLPTTAAAPDGTPEAQGTPEPTNLTPEPANPTPQPEPTPNNVTPAAHTETQQPTPSPTLPAQGDPFASEEPMIEPAKSGTPPATEQTAATPPTTATTPPAQEDPFAPPVEPTLEPDLPTTLPEQPSQPSLTAPEQNPASKGTQPTTKNPQVTRLPKVEPTPDVPAPETPAPVTPAPTTTATTPPPSVTPQPAPTPQPQLAQPQPTTPQPATSAKAQPRPQPAPAPTPGKADPRQVAKVTPPTVAPTQPTTAQRATPSQTVQPVPTQAKVGPAAAPSYSAQDVSRALGDAQAAAQAFASLAPTADKKEIKKKKAGYFRKLYDVAGRTTYAASMDDQQRGAAQHMALAATADKDKRVQVASAAAQWLKLAPAKRGPHPGVLLTGTIESVAPAGNLFQARLMPAWGGQTVTLVSAKPGELRPQANVVVTGAIIEQPQQQLAGYQGSDPQVVWTGMVLPTPNP